jgi:FkbM family methyltransferase
MHRDLIYDVGMHNGNDTAYYLHRGYRVVAVEADPALAEQARQRFAAELAAGRLTLLNVGIAAQDGAAEFWICDDKSEFNSFDKAFATKRGHTAHAIQISCSRFRGILEKHGTPHYLKIDIEGADLCCVNDLDPADLPAYVSLELTEPEQLDALRRAGYDRFKLVRQNDHAAVPDLTGPLATWWMTLKEKIPLLHKLARRCSRTKSKLRRWARRASRLKPGQWEFAKGSSGPFGEEAPGAWLDFGETVRRWQAFRRSVGGTGWVDVHATRHMADESADAISGVRSGVVDAMHDSDGGR